MRSEIYMLAALLIAGGCSATHPIGETVPAELAGNEPDAQMEFWHTLPQKRIASNDEAFHALLLFVDGADAAADYATRVDALKQRKMIPADFAAAPEFPVKRGTVAVAIA